MKNLNEEKHLYLTSVFYKLKQFKFFRIKRKHEKKEKTNEKIKKHRFNLVTKKGNAWLLLKKAKKL